MEPDYVDQILTLTAMSSGCIALFLVLLNSLAYGLDEGRDGPRVKQMVACMVAIVAFVLSLAAKMIRSVF
jgi:hypothetical protein